MNCTICHKPVVLSPSARERAAKGRDGMTAADYTALFPTHADCAIAARNTPLPVVAVRDMPPMFQAAEMLRLRQLVARTFGVEAGTRQTADYVNNLSEAALRAAL